MSLFEHNKWKLSQLAKDQSHVSVNLISLDLLLYVIAFVVTYLLNKVRCCNISMAPILDYAMSRDMSRDYFHVE